jgi:hypothetical protein
LCEGGEGLRRATKKQKKEEIKREEREREREIIKKIS